MTENLADILHDVQKLSSHKLLQQKLSSVLVSLLLQAASGGEKSSVDAETQTLDEECHNTPVNKETQTEDSAEDVDVNTSDNIEPANNNNNNDVSVTSLLTIPAPPIQCLVPNREFSFDPYCSRPIGRSSRHRRESSSSRKESSSRRRSSSSSRSRSPGIRRRSSSPSWLDNRRITSARKMPVPLRRHSRWSEDERRRKLRNYVRMREDEDVSRNNERTHIRGNEN